MDASVGPRSWRQTRSPAPSIRGGEPFRQEYRTLWVLHFADDGRVDDFEEVALSSPDKPFIAPGELTSPGRAISRALGGDSSPSLPEWDGVGLRQQSTPQPSERCPRVASPTAS